MYYFFVVRPADKKYKIVKHLNQVKMQSLILFLETGMDYRFIRILGM